MTARASKERATEQLLNTLKAGLREQCTATAQLEDEIHALRAKLSMEAQEFTSTEREMGDATARGTPRFGKKNCDVTAFTEDYLRGRPNREVSQSNKPIIRHDQTRDYKNTMVGNVHP